MREVTAELIRELVDYCPDTGEFTWKTRSRELFRFEWDWITWNERYAGTNASFPLQPNGERRKVMTLFHRRYYAHRVAWLYMTGAWPKGVIDHIDGDANNNRFSNLRDIPRAANLQNTKFSSRNTSGHMGVYKHARGKWVASITANGTKISLGVYDDVEDAGRAYLEAKKKYHPYQPVPRHVLSNGSNGR